MLRCASCSTHLYEPIGLPKVDNELFDGTPHTALRCSKIQLDGARKENEKLCAEANCRRDVTR